jgi:hypothetical protein
VIAPLAAAQLQARRRPDEAAAAVPDPAPGAEPRLGAPPELLGLTVAFRPADVTVLDEVLRLGDVPAAPERRSARRAVGPGV